jgi:glycosyltransferase involved in cell wall biosynthesis
MRALLINYELPPVGAGAGNATANIARSLVGRGVEVRVVTGRFRDLPSEEQRDGYVVHRAPSLRRRPDRCSPVEMLTFILGGAIASLSLASRWQPDVTCAFFGLPSGPISLVLRRHLGVPYVVSLRGGDVPGFLGGELAWYHRLAWPMTRAVWQGSAGLIANSAGLAELARRSWPNAPIEVIPNGVDVEAFTPGDRDRPSSPVRLLTVGRLVRQKGITYLLEALARCSSEVVLRVVGDGPERPTLEAAARSCGIQTRVQFVGWASRPELPEHYRWADVFVLPSLDEGMPNVVLEAMAAGLPIVATDVAGSRELVTPGSNGILVPPADSAALADAITDIVSSPSNIRQYGEQSRAEALRRSWQVVAARYERVLCRASADAREPDARLSSNEPDAAWSRGGEVKRGRAP